MSKTKSVFDYSATLLSGEEVALVDYKSGKCFLVVNIASMSDKTTSELTKLNELADSMKEKLIILAFPCNQFGSQEPLLNDELLTSLSKLRPGGGFVPKFQIFQKCDVNGSNSLGLFQFLRWSLPFPEDDPSFMANDPRKISWSPVSRNDVVDNFEKFLVGPDGVPYKRYSKHFPSTNFIKEVDNCLEKVDVQRDIKDLIGKFGGKRINKA